MDGKKRFFTRHPIHLSVKVRTPNGWQEMKTLDVSRRGIFVGTEDPIPAHRIAQMKIEMPSGNVIDAMGHVRRVVEVGSEEDMQPGMGIEFFVLSKEAEDEWDVFVLSTGRNVRERPDMVTYHAAQNPDLAAALVMEMPAPRGTFEHKRPKVSVPLHKSPPASDRRVAVRAKEDTRDHTAVSSEPTDAARGVMAQLTAGRSGAEPSSAQLQSLGSNRVEVDAGTTGYEETSAELVELAREALVGAARQRSGAELGPEWVPPLPTNERSGGSFPPPIPTPDQEGDDPIAALLAPREELSHAGARPSRSRRDESSWGPLSGADDRISQLSEAEETPLFSNDLPGDRRPSAGAATDSPAMHTWTEPPVPAADAPPPIPEAEPSGHLWQVAKATIAEKSKTSPRMKVGAETSPKKRSAARKPAPMRQPSSQVAAPDVGSPEATVMQESPFAFERNVAPLPPPPTPAPAATSASSTPAAPSAPSASSAPSAPSASSAPSISSAPAATSARSQVVEREDSAGLSAPAAAPEAVLRPRDKTTASLFITVRPADEKHLRQFMDRRLRVANVFLRSNIPCFPGQPIDVAVVHPETDAEVIVGGTIARVVQGESARDNGFLMRFSELDAARKKALVHFVNTGHPQIISPTAVDEEFSDVLRDLAERHPDSISHQLNYAWALLNNEEAPIDAVEPFLMALSLGPADIQVHLGLSLAYALAGDTAKSYAFSRSSRQLAVMEAARPRAGDR